MHHIFLCFIICVLTVFGCTNIPQPITEPQASHMTEKTPLPRSKAGYVYIIENVKTMGRGIYKIGMTQREDPNERIKEVGDPPYRFSIF